MGEHLPAVTGRISKFKEGHLKTTNPCLATAVRPSTPSFDRYQLHHRAWMKEQTRLAKEKRPETTPAEAPAELTGLQKKDVFRLYVERYRPVDIADRLRLPDDLVRGCIAKLHEKPATKKIKGEERPYGSPAGRTCSRRVSRPLFPQSTRTGQLPTCVADPTIHVHVIFVPVFRPSPRACEMVLSS